MINSCMRLREIYLEGTRCWKGYKKKGMKTMFGKRVPNCVKNENTGNPHKGKYMIKTDAPGRKDSDLVIMPDEKAAKQMVASLSKKKPDVKYWVELVEYNDWDNPTNDELERERQGADNFVLDRQIAEFEKQLQKEKQQNKKYNYETTKRNFYEKHGAEKAERMLYMMQQKGLFN